MAYGIDMPSAARRHLEAAEFLEDCRRDVAGYLYGIAAECAIKAMMLESGLRPRANHRTPDDPFYEHFPELRTLLRDSVQLRRGATLMRFIGNDAFMSNWSTSMRYSHGREILDRFVDAWATQAKQAVASIGT